MNVSDVRIRPATPEDWGAVEQLLRARQLPLAGARAHLQHFLVAVEGETAVGCIGLERYGDTGLLRSLAVAETHAGRGTGRALVSGLLDLAGRLGLRDVWLLTTTAADYFPRFGFEVVAREALPSSLGASEELRGACPASATAMGLALPVPARGSRRVGSRASGRSA